MPPKKANNKIIKAAENVFNDFRSQLRKIEAERDAKLAAIIKRMENKQIEDLRAKLKN